MDFCFHFFCFFFIHSLNEFLFFSFYRKVFSSFPFFSTLMPLIKYLINFSFLHFLFVFSLPEFGLDYNAIVFISFLSPIENPFMVHYSHLNILVIVDKTLKYQLPLEYCLCSDLLQYYIIFIKVLAINFCIRSFRKRLIRARLTFIMTRLSGP